MKKQHCWSLLDQNLRRNHRNGWFRRAKMMPQKVLQPINLQPIWLQASLQTYGEVRTLRNCGPASRFAFHWEACTLGEGEKVCQEANAAGLGCHGTPSRENFLASKKLKPFKIELVVPTLRMDEQIPFFATLCQCSHDSNDDILC
jgi:hypothetical protein